ncbi:MAG: hypothetical protein J5922_01505 [Clostridia bacterium]|nr:hypothetical protein [Clostridia bacterium]
MISFRRQKTAKIRYTFLCLPDANLKISRRGRLELSRTKRHFHIRFSHVHIITQNYQKVKFHSNEIKSRRQYKKQTERQRDGLIRQFFCKKVPAEKELENPFQQVFFIARLIPLQAGKYLYFPNEVADAYEVTRFAR